MTEWNQNMWNSSKKEHEFLTILQQQWKSIACLLFCNFRGQTLFYMHKYQCLKNLLLFPYILHSHTQFTHSPTHIWSLQVHTCHSKGLPLITSKTYTKAALIHSTSYTNSLTLKHIKISNDTQFAIFYTYILVMESPGLLLQMKCMVLLVKTMPMILTWNWCRGSKLMKYCFHEVPLFLLV